MNYEELFKSQLEQCKEIGEKALNQIKGSCFNGSEYKIGDKILFFFLQKINDKEINLRLVTIVPRLFDKLNKFKFIRYEKNNDTIGKKFPIFEGN